MKKKIPETLFVLLLLGSLGLPILAQSALDIDAYGVWCKNTGFDPADPNYDYLKGLSAEGTKWSDIQPSDSANFDWSTVQESLDVASERGQFVYLGVGVGPDSPEWLYENGVPKVYTDDTDHPKWLYYPYYMDPDYIRHLNKFIEGLADFLYSQPQEKLRWVSFLQVKTGCTGDEVAYKGAPTDSQYDLPKQGQEWYDFRLGVFEQYRQNFLVGEHKIPLLFNSVREEDYLQAWNWVIENIGSGFGIKEGALVRGHHLSKEKTVVDTWKPYLVNPKGLALFNRSEMDQSWKKPVFQINVELGFYWGVINGLNQGLTVNDVSNSALEEARDNPSIQNSYRLFNKYADQIYPETTSRAFIALHEGLDASDDQKFPESKYGSVNMGNESRYAAICNDPVYAARGARMDDLYAATKGQVYQRDKQTGYNDAGWDIWPTNYSRFITQIDPENTSIGLFRIGGPIDSQSPVYSRFARAFENSSGKNAMHFKLHEDFYPGEADTVTFIVIYLDKENGSTWELQYDAGPGDLKTAFSIKCNGSNTWKTQTVMVPDAVLNQNGHGGSDFALVNTDTKDDVFHMIEVEKGIAYPIRKKSSNAFLSSITWPDIPDSVSSLYGWKNRIIPGFQKKILSYTVPLPAGTENAPALAATTADVNATAGINRPLNLRGTLEERTSTITVTSEDGKTEQIYTVTFEVEREEIEDTQPFDADPFFSRLVYREFFNNNYIEISNPGSDTLDLSHYLVAMGISRVPDHVISDTLPFEKRYNYYVPGYDYATMDTFLYQPGRIVQDAAVNPLVEPGGSFVIGHIEDTDPEDRVHINDCDIIINKELSFDTNTKLIVAGPDAITKNGWMEGVLCLYKILNDSIRNGTKPISDPNDFELVDVFGTYNGSSWSPAGSPLLDEDNKWNLTRKSQFLFGDTLPGTEGSWGNTEYESEWNCVNREDYKAMGYGGSDSHLKLSEDIGNHSMETMTDYKSTITSVVYNVSAGYVSPQQISGIPMNTSFSEFLANIVRRNADQEIVLQANDGSIKNPEDEIVDGDSLTVTSADGHNETRYGLLTTSEQISSDAVLIPVDGSGYAIANNDTTGTISGIPSGISLSAVLDNVRVPENARLNVVNENNSLVPFQTLSEGGTYVATTACQDYFFEVTAEDNYTKIKYHLEIDVIENEAYAWSDLYIVNQESNMISGIPKATTVCTFFKHLKPNQGSGIQLFDRASLERKAGPVDFEDYVLVTSANGKVSKKYQLILEGEILGSEAFLNSEIYVVDQVIQIIDSILIETSITAFLQNITAAPFADVFVLNSEQTPVDYGSLEEGYTVLVISGDGTNETNYMLGFYGMLETEAYITSDIYSINQTKHTIDSIPAGTPINEFINNITPAPDATVSVLDENQNPVSEGNLGEGYTVQVTSEDGLTEQIYTIHFYDPDRVYASQLNAIQIYPNPVVDFLTIEGLPLNSTITVWNIFGSCISSISNENSESVTISTDELSTGLYFLRVQGGDHNSAIYKTIKN